VTARKPLRLGSYDYSTPGLYFVTVCASRRGSTFGSLHGKTVILDPAGEIIATHLRDRVGKLRGVSVDAWVVMPDHMHAVVVLENRDRRLSSVVGTFKSATAREIAQLCPAFLLPVWQRGYYDHVVRDDEDLERVREYIVTNPVRSAAR
jgi:putative transposase